MGASRGASTDAIIAASALAVGAELLTFDAPLRRIMAQEMVTPPTADKEA